MKYTLQGLFFICVDNRAQIIYSYVCSYVIFSSVCA